MAIDDSDFAKHGPFKPEEKINNYLILRLIGKGKNGWTYKAYDRLHDRIAALKIKANNPDPVISIRFQHEYRCLEEINSPHIPRAYDAPQPTPGDAYTFYAMEYVEGKTLNSYIRKQPGSCLDWLDASGVPLGDLLGYLRDVACALQAAHNQGIIHRDLHAGNIIIGQDGRCHVTDWGSAKITGSGDLTETFRPMGAATHCSLEQWEDSSKADRRSDLYSLGVLAYRALTLRFPYWADSQIALYEAVKGSSYAKISALLADIPLQVTDLVENLLSNDLSVRLGSADDLIHQIDGICSELARSGLGNSGQDQKAFLNRSKSYFIVRQDMVDSQLSSSGSPPVKHEKFTPEMAVPYVEMLQEIAENTNPLGKLHQCPRCGANVHPEERRNGYFYRCDQGSDLCYFYVVIFKGTGAVCTNAREWLGFLKC